MDFSTCFVFPLRQYSICWLTPVNTLTVPCHTVPASSKLTDSIKSWPLSPIAPNRDSGRLNRAEVEGRGGRRRGGKGKGAVRRGMKGEGEGGGGRGGVSSWKEGKQCGRHTLLDMNITL